MKKIIFLFIVLVLCSCTDKNSTPVEQITTYYEGFINSDYRQIKGTIADSLTTINGDYITPFTHESYHEQFKWDSVFKPVYKLVSIENQGVHPIATITLNSPKLKFLKNNPMTCRYKFQFKSGKIAKIENLDCSSADWEIWGEKVEALVLWVKVNHPELDGFINDLTMKGALNYVRAIELYQQREVKISE